MTILKYFIAELIIRSNWLKREVKLPMVQERAVYTPSPKPEYPGGWL
jgi:hypothetical protein